MPHRRTLLSLGAGLPLAGCSATDLANALTPTRDVAREEGLAYGPLPRQRFDLYRPAGLAADAPLLVFIHGGGWRGGSRGDYRFLGLPLAGWGCLVAIPDYRLWPETAFPGFVADTALAIRVLAAREPGRRLVLMGHSAGAFNAACVALDPAWGVQGLVGGFIGLAGPYDFRRDEVTPPEIFPVARIEAAPSPLRAGETPPLLLVHGAADTIVGPYHSRILTERAVAAGVPVRHVVIPGMGHLGPVVALSTPARWLGLADATVSSAVARFVMGSGA
jgi:acetyl esterase/lipase